MPESCTQSKFIVTRASPPSPEKEGRKLRLIQNTVFNMQIVNQKLRFYFELCGTLHTDSLCGRVIALW